MSSAPRRVVVVLGMHRSGTSTIARALQAIGVDLGGNLLPPAPGDNERGYWEDADIHALDMELLLALGHDWHTLAPVTPAILEGPVASSFRPRAAELLRKKIEGKTRFGLKDPRISRLIPFWKRIFDDVGVEASYAIVSRNPLSVARSLAKRDGFEPVKSHYLWLEHMLGSLVHTTGAPRVVVDYDAFMDDLPNQLRRLAVELDLPFDRNSAEFRAFRDEFVTESMRHTRFSPADLRADPQVPAAVASLYEALQGMSSGRVDPDGALVGPLLDYLSRLQDDLAPALAYMRTYEERSTNLARALEEGDAAQRELDRSLHEAEARAGAALDEASQLRVAAQALEALKLEMHARESEAAGLRASIAAREREIAALHEEALAREEELVRVSAQLQDTAAARAASQEQLAQLRAQTEEHRATTWSIPRPGRILRALRRRRGG